jgi:hypothetical protein
MASMHHPKNKGGLGILNLRLQNDALLLKHLHKFYNKENIPWVNLVWSKYYINKVPHATREVGSFWWKDILRLNSLYRSIASCSLGDGSTVLFWDDKWSHVILAETFPHLLQFSRNDRISVQGVMQAEDLDSLFMLPLTQEAFTVSFDESIKDKWTLAWGSNTYSSSRLYKLAFQGLDTHPIFAWVWKSRCMNRIKFFAWLILMDRLNTKSMLKRRNMLAEEEVNCIMCNLGEEEDIDHLFFSCPFAQQCWQKLNVTWDNTQNLATRVSAARSQYPGPFFMEISLIASWEIWKLRNRKVFDNVSPRFATWFSNFKNQCRLQSERFKVDDRSSFCVWIDAFS